MIIRAYMVRMYLVPIYGVPQYSSIKNSNFKSLQYSPGGNTNAVGGVWRAKGELGSGL